MPGLLPLVAAVAALHTVDVPKTLGHKLQKAKASNVPVFVASAFNTTIGKLYPDVRVEKGLYELDLGLVKGCHGANACGFASFIGQDGGRVSGKRVPLHGGLVGRYTKPGCGASCAAPQISWRRSGVAYTFTLKDVRGDERVAMIAFANQAIDHGPYVSSDAVR